MEQRFQRLVVEVTPKMRDTSHVVWGATTEPFKLLMHCQQAQEKLETKQQDREEMEMRMK